ncbi:hypothetical protein MY5147_009945 [Beauveria neobassiana]
MHLHLILASLFRWVRVGCVRSELGLPPTGRESYENKASEKQPDAAMLEVIHSLVGSRSAADAPWRTGNCSLGAIIAVPGLGAHPYHTWEARKTRRPSAAEHQNAQSRKARLLKDLVAHDFPEARIWNFAHDSNWLIDAPVKTTAEIGKCLLAEIKDKRSSPPC